MSGSSRSGIVTPEAVELELPLAAVGSRAIAFVLDLFIVVLTVFLLGFGAAAVVGATDPGVPDWVGAVLLLLLVVLARFGYPIAFETLLGGRTPGMMALGLRVVTQDGGPIRFRHAALRAVLGIVDFDLTVGLVALVTASVSARGQRLGDMVAGTVVLRERRSGGPARPVAFTAPAALAAYAGRLDVSLLGTAEYAALRTFLMRAPTLPADTRARLGADLAERLRGRVQPAPPAGTHPEAFLQAVAASYQQRHDHRYGHVPHVPHPGVPPPPPAGPPPPPPQHPPAPTPALRSPGPTPRPAEPTPEEHPAAHDQTNGTGPDQDGPAPPQTPFAPPD